jgi:hypothetical protein
MEFCKINLINTSTQISVTNNTQTASNVFNRDKYFQYYTDGLNNDLTTASITITFGQTTPVSRLALIDTNLKDFTIFYNGSTANSFTLVNANTTTSSFTENASDNLYMRFATIQCSSITIDMKKTITANQEKVLGLFFISDLYYSLGNIPNSGGYKPQSVPKQIVHTLSDGGIRIHNVRNKFNLNIDLDYLMQSEVTQIKSIYDRQQPFQFAAFGTSTGWTNPVFFESNWVGAFNFYEFSNDAAVSGFSGKIQLRETPT